MKLSTPLALCLCGLTYACGDYWALCIEDTSATRDHDDRVNVEVTLNNCSLGADRDWPEGKDYCVEARWIEDGSGETIDTIEACDDKSIPLGENEILAFGSGEPIPPDAGVTMEIDVVGQAGGPARIVSPCPLPDHAVQGVLSDLVGPLAYPVAAG